MSRRVRRQLGDAWGTCSVIVRCQFTPMPATGTQSFSIPPFKKKNDLFILEKLPFLTYLLPLHGWPQWLICLHPTTHRFTVPLLHESKPSLFGLPGFISPKHLTCSVLLIRSILVTPKENFLPARPPAFLFLSAHRLLARKHCWSHQPLLRSSRPFSLTLLYRAWRFSAPVATRLQTPPRLFPTFDVSKVDTLDRGLPKSSQAAAPQAVLASGRGPSSQKQQTMFQNMWRNIHFFLLAINCCMCLD